MLPLLRTARLVLRPFCEDDLAFLDALHDDVEVYRYLGDGKPRSTALHRGWLARTLAQHAEGLGQRVVERDGRPIGRCGITRYFRDGTHDGARLLTTDLPSPDPQWSPFLEMGWTFERAAWGHGYASEAAERVLSALDEAQRAQPLYAMIHVENTRSIRVAERRGWRARQRATLFDRPMALYGP